MRPILEYNCQVWSPAYLYLINKIERVQKSFTKRLHGLSDLSYSGRLIWLGADSLATRRLKIYLVLFYDVVHVHDNIDVDLPLLDIVDPNVTHTCGHSFGIIKQQCRINARLKSFACRNVNAWNSLPENVVWCHSRATFKGFIDLLDFSKFWTSVGRYQSHLWPTSPFNILTLFILFFSYMC